MNACNTSECPCCAFIRVRSELIVGGESKKQKEFVVLLSVCTLTSNNVCALDSHLPTPPSPHMFAVSRPLPGTPTVRGTSVMWCG
jgi:hypothetical protein